MNFLYSRNIIGKKWDYARGDLLSSLTMPQGGACQWFSSGAAKAAHQSSGSFPQDDMLIYVEGESYTMGITLINIVKVYA